MLLQYLQNNELPLSQKAYFSLDDIYFSNHTLVDTVNRFYQQGGKLVVFDKVHKYKGWAREIKNI